MWDAASEADANVIICDAHIRIRVCVYIYIYIYIYIYTYCYSTDYSQQASCLLQTGQLSILLPQLAG